MASAAFRRRSHHHLRRYDALFSRLLGRVPQSRVDASVVEVVRCLSGVPAEARAQRAPSVGWCPGAGAQADWASSNASATPPACAPGRRGRRPGIAGHALDAQQPVALLDEPLPQRRARSAKPRWAAAYSRFPRASRSAPARSPAREVVRRRAHVEHADRPGPARSSRRPARRGSSGRAGRRACRGPCPRAGSRLLVRLPVVAAGLEGVERPGRVGEEPEGVEVRAGDPVRLDDRVGARGAQPQRPAGCRVASSACR